MTCSTGTQSAEVPESKVLQVRSVSWPLVGLSLSMLMASLDTSIANAGLPVLATAFSSSFQLVQWVVLSYLLAVTTLIVSVGRFGDIVGRRRLLLTGIGLFTGASILCGMASSLGILIASRAVQGLGAAAMMALSLSFVGETVPKEKTGRAMGLLGTMSAIGTALGPSLGGFLITLLGWRSIFLVNVPIGFVALLVALRFLPVDPKVLKVNGSAFDSLGTIVLALTLGMYALAMTMGHGKFGTTSIALMATVIAGFSLFVFIEGRVAMPLVQLSLFRNFDRNASLIATALVSTVMMSTFVVGPFYLSRALGLNATQVGMVLSVGPIVVALNGIPAGRLADHFGAWRITVIGLCTMVVGSLLLYESSITGGVGGYIAPIVVITTGYAFFQTSNNTLIMSAAPPDQRGVISGMLNLSRNLGLISGASLMGALFAFATGYSEVTTAGASSIARGMRFTFGTAAILVTMALALVLGTRVAALRRIRRPEQNLLPL